MRMPLVYRASAGHVEPARASCFLQTLIVQFPGRVFHTGGIDPNIGILGAVTAFEVRCDGSSGVLTLSIFSVAGGGGLAGSDAGVPHLDSVLSPGPV